MAQSANCAVFASGLQPQYSKSLWDNHPLLLVVRPGDTLEDLEAFHGSGTASGFVRDHAADSLVEDARRSTEVERA